MPNYIPPSSGQLPLVAEYTFTQAAADTIYEIAFSEYEEFELVIDAIIEAAAASQADTMIFTARDFAGATDLLSVGERLQGNIASSGSGVLTDDLALAFLNYSSENTSGKFSAIQFTMKGRKFAANSDYMFIETKTSSFQLATGYEASVAFNVAMIEVVNQTWDALKINNTGFADLDIISQSMKFYAR